VIAGDLSLELLGILELQDDLRLVASLGLVARDHDPALAILERIRRPATVGLLHVRELDLDVVLRRVDQRPADDLARVGGDPLGAARDEDLVREVHDHGHSVPILPAIGLLRHCSLL